MRSAAGAAIVVFGLASGAAAVQPDELLADPRLEARAREVSAELRCLVCQNQSIDDSEAPLARDLRLLVRERLRAGDSDADVRDFITRRYGEFVLLKPTFTWHTALLWLGPPVLILAALGGLASVRRSREAGPPPLSEVESRELAALLDEDVRPPGVRPP